MKLLEMQLEGETRNLIKNNVRLNVIGGIEDLPDAVKAKLKKSLELTRNNTGVVLTIALSYGARAEIINAARKILDDIGQGRIKREDIDEKLFSSYLYTANLPDPDLLIRTSGEMRVSNFLLWQISYSEFYVTKKYWPDFGKKDLEKAVGEYQRRQRRYGA
jgi:undecaprenyl diphosphate synthase